MGSEAPAECCSGLVQQRSLTHMHAVGSACAADDDDAARAPDRETTEVRALGVREGLRSTCCLRHDSALHGYVHIVPVNATQVLSCYNHSANRLSENQSQPFKYLINAF